VKSANEHVLATLYRRVVQYLEFLIDRSFLYSDPGNTFSMGA